jgi:hypothetical protein
MKVSLKIPFKRKPVQQRTEFRVACRAPDGTEITWIHTETFDDARKYIEEIEPRFRILRDWCVYEVEIIEVSRVAYTESHPKRAFFQPSLHTGYLTKSEK